MFDIWKAPTPENQGNNGEESKEQEEKKMPAFDPKEFSELERMQDDQFVNSNFWKIKLDDKNIDDMINDIE